MDYIKICNNIISEINMEKVNSEYADNPNPERMEKLNKLYQKIRQRLNGREI